MTYSSQAYAVSLVEDRRRAAISHSRSTGLHAARARHVSLVATLMRGRDHARRAGGGAAQPAAAAPAPAMPTR
jgi:hypothetical protein